MLPASAMGQTLVVTMQATDEDRLKSNIVDMTVLLNESLQGRDTSRGTRVDHEPCGD
jgi:hypothetical protein